MKIVIVIPTRGTVFTEVLEAVEKNRFLYNIDIVYSKNLPIPIAQNYLVDIAIKKNPDYIWFLEEDTVPPENALQDLLSINTDISFIDYAVNGWSCSAINKNTGEVLWCGLGCTLVKLSVFQKLKKPYFRTDQSLRLNDWQWINNPMKYGGQDIWFFTHAREAGFKIIQVQGECRHLKIESIGKSGTNLGIHNIIARSPISKWQKIEVPENKVY